MNGLASRGEPAAVSVCTWKRGCTSHSVRTTISTVPHCTENMAVEYNCLDLALQRGTGTVKPLIATETEFEEPACRMPDEKYIPQKKFLICVTNSPRLINVFQQIKLVFHHLERRAHAIPKPEETTATRYCFTWGWYTHHRQCM